MVYFLFGFVMSIQALVCSRLTPSFAEGISALSLSSLPRTPSPLAQGKVRVRVMCVALNYFDLLTLVGKYQIKVRERV